MKAARLFSFLLMGAGLLVVAFLALRPSPYVNELPWMPRWLGEWADHHGNLRNLPAFAGLALLLLWPLRWRTAGALAAVMAVAVEGAQVFISGRTFDWADIGWSLLGVALVSAPAALLSRFCSRRKPCS